MQPTPIIYDDDARYPGPQVHPPPEYISGIPSQGELDAQARMFTWGELKGIVRKSARQAYDLTPSLNQSCCNLGNHILGPGSRADRQNLVIWNYS